MSTATHRVLGSPDAASLSNGAGARGETRASGEPGAPHDQFYVVKAGETWRAECKSCPWVGPSRRHPLDCSEDTIAHTGDTA